MAIGERPHGLLGRRSECQTLDRLLSGVQSGESQVLVLRGEAGIGKSALLEYVAEQAAGCHVARVAGVQSEMELAFAGLHQLCLPMLDGLGGLPEPQRVALSEALGLTSGGAPDHFRVALAVLSLLAGQAEDRPLVCVVDDAQWLDRASRQALSFVARRLLAERIAMVFAVREPTDEDDLAGLPELHIEGLGDSDARTMLASAFTAPLDTRVRDRIVAETRGNPLALLELPRGLTRAELAGGFGLPDRDPLTSRIERSFLRRFESLPPDTRRLLLLAAAEPTGDVPLLWAAAARLGIGPAAAGPAEAAELVELGARVRFRHPLVRSAIYRAAAQPDRQEVHRALAEATDPGVDPDRRAWHRAHAAAGLDEEVAGELERSAGRAQARGGIAANAAFLERAAELTPDPALRGARVLTASQARLDAGSPDAAEALLATAELAPLDELKLARLEQLRAMIGFARTRGNETPALLLAAARRLEPLDAAMARETHLEALTAAMFAGRLGGSLGVRDIALAASAAPPAGDPPRATDLLLDALVVRLTEGYAAGLAPLREALDVFRRQEMTARDVRWLSLACRLAQDLWDDDLWHALATRGLTVAREAGALSVLPVAATYTAAVEVHAGAFKAASALIDETRAILQATGMAPVKYASLILAAWRGDPAVGLPMYESGRHEVLARGEGRGLGVVDWATALLLNANGRYAEALAAARRGCAHDDVGVYAWSLAELVEAAVRSESLDDARSALDRLSARTQAAGTGWALGVEAGARALMTEGPDAEPLYEEAIERLSRTRGVVHVARARLVYGEWLRRESRRVDARDQLRAAHETFDRIGAGAFAERSRRELTATGETVRRLTVDTRDTLTPQESQVALLAQNGRTNPEIGAELFISPRTVEYHLHKVFAKLGIRSRRELRAALAEAGVAAAPA
jgi:DNA-binding CsgD family transcriptional regulator